MNVAIEKELISKASVDKIERFVVGAIILNVKNEFLLLRRNANDFMGGIDELPSGKVEEDDNSLFQALEREVLEETNLKIKKIIDYISCFDYVSKSGKKTRQFNFYIQVDGYDVKIDPKEHNDYYWISQKNLEKTKLTPSILNVLKNFFNF